MSVAALVLAAGSGERLGHHLPKAFVQIGGKPLVLYSLETLASVREIDCVVPVLAVPDLDRFRALGPALADIPKLAEPVAGGARRQDSVRAGLAALPAEVSWVAVHDAARPLVRPQAVARVVAAARRDGAAILAAPVADTVKRVREGRVIETPDRAECWAAQTPQVFRVDLLREALAKADAEGRLATDDAQLVEWLGVPVSVVAGDSDNRKVTYAEDLAAVERALCGAAQPADGERSRG
ncbi:MAG: 2-C-methyl-D-erythritol 4-phosphate cytidylyltransferase [Myxococcales bacterium]|nr:2-C-methyl-D-erythritol 4-phosphate cytidylyltransferase [Myxococcales bacterium]